MESPKTHNVHDVLNAHNNPLGALQDDLLGESPAQDCESEELERDGTASERGIPSSTEHGSPDPSSQLSVSSSGLDGSVDEQEIDHEDHSDNSSEDDESQSHLSLDQISFETGDEESISSEEEDTSNDSRLWNGQNHSSPSRPRTLERHQPPVERPIAAANHKLLFASDLHGEAQLAGAAKPKFYNTLTISDDRTAGSEIEKRNLLALRGHVKNTGDAQLLHYSITLPSHQMGARHRIFHQRQPFMLLEAQNQQRLAIARRMTDIPDPGVRQARAMAQGDAVMSTGKGTSGRADEIPMTQETEKSQGHPIEADLQNAISGEDTSTLDLQKLQDYIEHLQARALRLEASHKEHAPSRYQVLYRLFHHVKTNSKGPIPDFKPVFSQPFLDHPTWVEGKDNTRHIQCNLPLKNFDLYLEKNKGISFIVYRNFESSIGTIQTEASTDTEATDHNNLPKYTSETIQPTTNDLKQTISTILEAREEHSETLKAYEDSDELPAPYLFMYHSRKSLECIQESLPLPAQRQLAVFLGFINEQYGEEYATADSLFSQNEVSADYVKYLFKPGDILIARKEGKYRAYVATSWPGRPHNRTISHLQANSFGDALQAEYFGSTAMPGELSVDKRWVDEWDVQAWSWTFDGKFQRQRTTLSLQIPMTEDEKNGRSKSKGKENLHEGACPQQTRKKTKHIADLNVFPIKYASEDIVNLLRRRGKTFWNCRNRRFVSYQEDVKGDIQNLAEERYMIDLKTYRSLHGDHQFGQLVDELGAEAMEKDDPPQEQFDLLLPHTIKGYNLRRKKWFDLKADRISDVKWNQEAFQSLVIDRKARDLIQALVSKQLASEKSTDLIPGKGNGLLLLLHGGPGTGKTLTAESVAEIAEKPLYRVTCGDVGTKAEDVEKYLESVLHLGKIWGCVVLLDEADVFLEQRSLEDLQRNALVSVFLRILEYYEGILILTSNRVGTFDEAFKSRIQLALHYPNLGSYQRLRIWETFINRLESFGDAVVDIADLRDHLEDLKEVKMNGRQIRNVITTARQYAEWKQTVLTYDHLKDVIEISGRFDKYLDRLNGGISQDDLAEDEGLRLASR